MEILIIFILILLNGVFAMGEIAMVSSRKARLEIAAKRGDASARKALELAGNPAKFLSTVQIGITLIGVLTGVYSGEEIQDDLIVYLNRFEVLQPYSENLATACIVVILTFFSLVLGELVPKRIGLSMPESISRLLAFPMYWISVITAPFTWLLTFFTDLIIRIFRMKTLPKNRVTEEEIKALIQEGLEGGAIEEIEQDIMERVFSLGNRKVASLMTHRHDIVFLQPGFDAAVVREVVNREMHSVYPVMNPDKEVLGIILLKDLFRNLQDRDFQLKKLIKQPQYVSEHLSAYEALKLFKAEKNHQAIVMDEYGQMQGLITLNDLLEALVGDVSEFYSSEFTFSQRTDGSWLIDGQYPLADLLRKFDLDEFAEEYPFNTISGLILHELKRIPVAGDTLPWLHFIIEIVDMDGARIDKVLLTSKTHSDASS